MDVRGEWFYQEHYTEEELEQLHTWNKSIGMKAHAILLPSGMYGGYHQADKEKSLLLVSMGEKNMVDNWLIRIGFNKVSKPTPPPSLVIREGSTKVRYIDAVTKEKEKE